MSIYLILVISGVIMFLSSIVLWLNPRQISGQEQGRPEGIGKYSNYLFISSFSVFFLSLLFWSLLYQA